VNHSHHRQSAPFTPPGAPQSCSPHRIASTNPHAWPVCAGGATRADAGGATRADDASDDDNDPFLCDTSSDDDDAVDDRPPDCVSGALYATVRGLNPDGIRVQAALEEVSSALWKRDAAAEEREQRRSVRHRVNFADGCPTLKQTVWKEVEGKLQCPSNLSRVSCWTGETAKTSPTSAAK